MTALQTSEFKIKPSCQPHLLPSEQVWSRFGQSIDQQYRLTISCSFYG